jgi:HSP20 family protein
LRNIRHLREPPRPASRVQSPPARNFCVFIHPPNPTTTLQLETLTMRIVQYHPASHRLASPVFARSPWAGIEGELDRLFSVALTDIAGAPAARFPVDLYEDKDNTYVRAELPGVSRDDIGVEVADGELTLTATRKTPAADGQPEQSVSFSRTIALGDAVQADQVAAAYENGVLTVTLPKREEAKPKKITVAVK